MHRKRIRETEFLDEGVTRRDTDASTEDDDSNHVYLSRRHPCGRCKKSFTQRSGLETHSNVHTGNKPFLCGIGSCKAKFGDPSSCARHRKEVHETQGTFSCFVPGCKSKIKRRSAFKEHLKKKHDISVKPEDLDRIAPITNRLTSRSKLSANQGSSRQSNHNPMAEPREDFTFLVDPCSVPPMESSDAPLDDFLGQVQSLMEPVVPSTLFSDRSFIPDQSWASQSLSTDALYTSKSSPSTGRPSLGGTLSPCPPETDHLRLPDTFSGGRTNSLSPALAPLHPAVRQQSPNYVPVGPTVYGQPGQKDSTPRGYIEQHYDSGLFGMSQQQQQPNLLPPLIHTNSFYASSSPSTASLSDSPSPSPYAPVPSPRPTGVSYMQALVPFSSGQTSSLFPDPPSLTLRQKSPVLSPYLQMSSHDHQRNPVLKRKSRGDSESDSFETRRVRSRIV